VLSDRKYGLVGDPVAHSLSPRLFRAAFEYLEIPAFYRAHRVPRGDDEGLRMKMRELASGGGNVTVPHKESAARLLDVRSINVERTGATNCFWLDPEGRLVGDNTDVGGFLAAAADLEGFRLEEAAVLLLGAGGAARAIAAACASAGVRQLDVWNRSAGRAETLISDLGLAVIASVSVAPASSSHTYDLVVNATSLGLDPADPLPLELEADRFRYALDLVYGPGGTDWTRHASEAGVPALDGHSMLVNQALLSLERWIGEVFDRDGVARAMWKAVAATPDRISR
jgi:shikimate dehydrogenase